MKSFKPNFSDSITLLYNKTNNIIKFISVKIFCCVIMLLLCGNTLFSQSFSTPLLEHRIINLRYEPSWQLTSHGAVVFDLQIKAGVGYTATGCPMTSTDIMMLYNNNSGIRLDLINGYGILPSSNPVGITAAEPNPWCLVGTNGIRLHLDKDVSPSNPTSNNFTDEFVTVATFVLPVLAGVEALTSDFYLEFYPYDDSSIGSAWSSELDAADPHAYNIDSSIQFHLNTDPDDTTNTDLYFAEFKIYPNPATSGNTVTFQLKLEDNELPDAIAYIFDITGKIIRTYHLTNYSTEVVIDFAPGSYVVKGITKTGREFIEKMIIQK